MNRLIFLNRFRRAKAATAEEWVVDIEIRGLFQNIYPKNANATLFCELLGQKTLTRRNLRIIKELGYTINVFVKPIDLSFL